MNSRTIVPALLALTAVTGLIDAVSYLRLGRVFVANMTGNVVFIGLSAYPHSGLSAVASLVAIAGFLLGALSGGRLATALGSRPRRWLTTAFGTEALIVAAVAVLGALGVLPLGPHRAYVTIALLAVALGIQNSTVRRIAAADLTTTVLTMTLTGIAADNALAGGTGSKPARRVGSVVVMLAGAAVGATLLRASASLVIGVAAGVIAVVAIVASRNVRHEEVDARPGPRRHGLVPTA
jgi:uncharacterized membrane protein YoaK (UPF0700 family)